MCLGIVVKVIKMDRCQDTALVEFSGVRCRVGTAFIRHAAAGDYLLVHAGQGLEKINREEAEARICLWEEVLSAESTEVLPGY
jgi:hydrogenase assembly chaperone HypC/HupF